MWPKLPKHAVLSHECENLKTETIFFLLIKKKCERAASFIGGLMVGRSDSTQVGGLTQGQNNSIAMFQ